MATGDNDGFGDESMASAFEFVEPELIAAVAPPTPPQPSPHPSPPPSPPPSPDLLTFLNESEFTTLGLEPPLRFSPPPSADEAARPARRESWARAERESRPAPRQRALRINPFDLEDPVIALPRRQAAAVARPAR